MRVCRPSGTPWIVGTYPAMNGWAIFFRPWRDWGATLQVDERLVGGWWSLPRALPVMSAAAEEQEREHVPRSGGYSPDSLAVWQTLGA